MAFGYRASSGYRNFSWALLGFSGTVPGRKTHTLAVILRRLHRLTDRAHILETGTESFRFRRTIASRQKNTGRARVTGEVVEDRPSASP